MYTLQIRGTGKVRCIGSLRELYSNIHQFPIQARIHNRTAQRVCIVYRDSRPATCDSRDSLKGMGEPTSVSELLQRAELLQYADAFKEQGYGSIPQLRDITEADLVDLIRDVQMRKGHVKRLPKALGREGSMEGSAGESSNAPAEPKATAPATALVFSPLRL